MDCPYCSSVHTTRLPRTTGSCYAVFGCTGCGRTFNERTGTPFNDLDVPTGIVFPVRLCRVRQLSYCETAELFLLCGFDYTHETVQDGKERCQAPC